MPVYFDSKDSQYGKSGSEEWTGEVFRRAYVLDSGPFSEVEDRLALGFSVLVYLPGNCIRAASERVQRVSPELKQREWKVFGRADSAGQTLAEIWQGYTGLLDLIKTWWSGTAEQPHAIFENLDLLDDGHGGLDQSDPAKTALFYLTDCVRNGVALGLSDLSAGELPQAVRRVFDEEVWLAEVTHGRFGSLVPRMLADKLAGSGGTIARGPLWSLASRLRWIDPIRAVRIMERLPAPIDHALQEAARITRTAEFTLPVGEPLSDAAIRCGFETATVELLEHAIIEPYRDWAGYTGNDSEAELRKLPPGLILYGPPGTGKTSLARWIAGRIGIPVRQVAAADLKRSDWGLTERLVRELFATARRAAPCVIVLDDADDLLRERARLQGGLASAEGSVVNAFLQEIEGYRGTLEGVLTILTTNRFDAIDPAVNSRLGLHKKIPYPLTRDQVAAIVEEGLRRYGLPGDDEAFLHDLAGFFFASRSQPHLTVDDPGERRRAREGLFAARDIVGAMRLLLGPDPQSAGLKRLRAHYEELAELALAQDK
jgi:hypothetical protein